MKLRVLFVGLAAAMLLVSAAVAAPPAGKGKPPTKGAGCKPISRDHERLSSRTRSYGAVVMRRVGLQPASGRRPLMPPARIELAHAV